MSDLIWTLGFTDNIQNNPKEFFSANVPGAVQLDYMNAYNLPDYRADCNFLDYQWMQEKFWIYKTVIDLNNYAFDERVFIVFNGIDYKYDFLVNGKTVESYEGMYKHLEYELTEFKGSNVEISVRIYPFPKSNLPDVNIGTRDEANQCCKPAVSYGWDFHPRLIPLGIWDDVNIKVTKDEPIAKPEVGYTLSEDRSTATVHFNIDEIKNVKWYLYSPSGELIYSSEKCIDEFTISDVKLWWSNGYGEPNLYSWRLETQGGQFIERKLGFRTIELVKGEGTWRELSKYPMSRNTPPITFKLNGVEIFAKGSNWVAPEIFYGAINGKRYYELLKLVKDANLNFLRCWGGAIINKEEFFNICDELGIMIWQEFPLSCNRYVATPNYMSVLRSEATVIINRLKNHTCLSLWCGGNELFNSWSLMDDQSPALRMLNSLTFDLTPQIPFLPTSPIDGMAHGAYTFCYPDGREAMQAIADSKYTAYTEFGIPSVSCENTLKMIAPVEKLYPLENNKIVKMHHYDHIHKNVILKYFDEGKNISEYMKNSQLIQSFGLQCIYEEARRQKPYCSVVSNWCFDEPWPCIANNSVVSYPCEIKPAYYSVKNACRKVVASAKIHKFSYKAGECLEFELSLLNDSLEKLPDGTIDAYIKIGDDFKEHLLSWNYKDVPINRNCYGPTVRYNLPVVDNASEMQIVIDCKDYSSVYTLLYSKPLQKVKGVRETNVLDI